MKSTVSSLVEKLRAKPNGRPFTVLFDVGDSSDYPTSMAADLALCTMIAQETIDPALIDDVYKESALYRPKAWNRDNYNDSIIQQAIAAVKASKGIPSFIVQTIRKDKLVEKVSPAMLDQWIRDYVTLCIVRDDDSQTVSI